MKVASLREGGRDGTLVVISRNLKLGHRAGGITPTLIHALENWDDVAPRLTDLYIQLNNGSPRDVGPRLQAQEKRNRDLNASADIERNAIDQHFHRCASLGGAADQSHPPGALPE